MGVRHSRKVTQSARWKRLRTLIVKRDQYKCVSCGTAGPLEVDHIKPVKTHPELSWDMDNLQSLCPTCHTYKTRQEIGYPDVTESRRQWRRFIRQPI